MSKKFNKIYSGLIPYDLQGNQLHYPESFYHDFVEWDNKTRIGKNSDNVIFDLNVEGVELEENIYPEPRKLYSFSDTLYVARVHGQIWLPNCIFEDTFTYSTYSRGRSAAYFHFVKESDGKGVTVFMTDFNVMINKMIKGKITGKFTFGKSGQNFGCKLI